MSHIYKLYVCRCVGRGVCVCSHQRAALFVVIMNAHLFIIYSVCVCVYTEFPVQ